MKQLLLICLFSFCAFSQINAQVCTPDPTFADSVFGVYPPPFDPAIPESGIYETACLNSPYEFLFTFVIPDSIKLENPDIETEIIEIKVTGLSGKPQGMAFATAPADGVFTPADQLGCALLYGTPTNPDDIGDHPLIIEGYVKVPLFGEIDFDLVLSALGGDGYTLTVEPEGSTTCSISTSTEVALNDNMTIETAPNPFSSFTNVTIKSDVAETLQFRVVNLLGELVHAESISVNAGDNVVEFDGSQLANGVYQFSFSNGADVLTQKVILQK